MGDGHGRTPMIGGDGCTGDRNVGTVATPAAANTSTAAMPYVSEVTFHSNVTDPPPAISAPAAFPAAVSVLTFRIHRDVPELMLVMLAPLQRIACTMLPAVEPVNVIPGVVSADPTCVCCAENAVVACAPV